jgi:hypothetical protein
MDFFMKPMDRFTDVVEIRYERFPSKDVPGKFGTVVAAAL